MQAFFDNFAHSIIRILSSNKFLVAIITLTVAQALWYAVSFVPWVNDEAQHFRVTEIYTHRVSPFIAEQPLAWDQAGAVTRNGSYLFYYVMSWPLRLLQVMSDDEQVQLFGLRVLMTLIFVSGILVYRKILLNMGVFSRAAVHGLLFIFVLTPTVGLLAGMYNYDVVVFTLFSLILYGAIVCIRSHDVPVKMLAVVIGLSGLILLIKWTSIALVVPVLAYVLYSQFKHFGSSLPRKLCSRFWRIKAIEKVLILAGLVTIAGLVIERPVQNMIVYGQISPQCSAVLSHQRCMKNATYRNYQKTLSQKDEAFSPLYLPAYAARYWVPRMADSATNLFERGLETRLPVAFMLYFASIVLSFMVIAIRIRQTWKSLPEFQLFLLVGVVYTAILMIDEYMIYTKYGIPGAVRARYLVPLLPLYFAVVVYSLLPIVNRYKTQAVVVGCGMIAILLSQGDSIVSHVMVAPREAYVSQEAYELNQSVKKVLAPIVIEPSD